VNRAERRAAGKQHTKPPKVVIGVVHPGEVSMAHMASVMRARDHMLQYGMTPGFIERRARSQHVHRARNEIVQGFLASDCDYLFFVDADMGIPRNAIERLLSVAHVDERPVVAGLCFAQRDIGFCDDDYSTSFDIVPTVQLWNIDDDDEVTSFGIVEDYPRDAVIQIDGTGGACVMIHRGVLEKMRERWDDHWFTPIKNKNTGGPFGEDTSFFLRCRRIGIPVHMDTSVKTSHDKGGVFLTEELWDLQQALREAP
jgi:glycosyltransferase involved in cell wall biosynthesis